MVRKIVPILLIAVLLFNVLGYYGIFIGLRLKNTQDLIERLDADRYSDEETVTLKVPLAVPYHADTDDYTRVDGEVEHNGEFYRLVKQKLTHDTLYIVCIKDKESKKIKQALSDYVKTFSDKPVDTKHSAKSLFSFIKDYIPTTIAISSLTAGWDHSISWSLAHEPTRDFLLSIPSPPPKS